MRFIAKFIGFFLVFLSILVMLGYIYYGYDLPNIQDYLDSRSEKVVQINYSNGNQITRYGSSNRSKAEFYELPTHLINAVIAVEDQNFFNHKGFDLKGIIRAFSVNHQSGKIVQGGSTITQQLAKILFLGPEKKMKRKIKELILAFRLESALTKEQIITLYLNNTYFGSGNYGVSAASKYYFGKDVSEISLKESTLLAALLKAPSTLSNVANRDIANQRADLVLEKMINSKFIDANSYQESISSPVTYKKNRLQKFYFADYVYKNYRQYAKSGNYEKVNIQTTLDEDFQNIVENELNIFLASYEKTMDGAEISVVVVDKNGSIKAMSGGKDYQKSQFNRAIYAKRQIGSLYKTFIYLYAFENGFTPNDKIEDKKLEFADGWEPKNYDDKYRGKVNLLNAFSNSLNSVSIQLSKELGVKNIAKFANKMGVDLDPGSLDLTSSLGSFEDSLLNMTCAYAAIINNGSAVIPSSIIKIEDENFGNLYSKESSGLPRLISNRSLKYIKSSLQSVIEQGTGVKARVENVKIMGKTGTSQNNRDAWFIGLNEDVAIGVWIGNDDGTPTKGITGGSLPAILFANIMQKVNQLK